MRKGEPIKKGSEVIGNKVKVKVAKNKVAPPFKACEIDLIYGKGFDSEGEIATVAVNKGIIDKSGSWFSYKGEKIGQGIEAVKAWLKDPDTRQKVMDEIKKEPVIDEETGELLN